MAAFIVQVRLFGVGLIRDKVLWSLFVVSLLMVFSLPLVSQFSMRQVQQLAITLSFSCTSVFLLVLVVFLGSTSIWNDLNRRHVIPLLTLPISRKSYVLARYAALAIFMLVIVLVLALVSSCCILILAQQYRSDKAVEWLSFYLAYGMVGLKYLLLLSFSYLLSVLSTSFFLPVFGTFAIYLVGSASRQVYEYVLQGTDRYSDLFVWVVKGLYFLLPNFSVFDFQVYATYSLELPAHDLLLSALYGIVYIVFVLGIASVLFTRREV